MDHKKLKYDTFLKDNDSSSRTKKFKSFSLFTFIKENIQMNKFYRENYQKDYEIIGYFHLLPEEILIKIFQFLTIEELSVLTLVNSKIRNFIVEHFLLSSSGFLFLIRANQIHFDPFSSNQQSTMLKLFSSIGLFLKRCTLLFRTNERINLLIYVLENSYGIPSIKSFNYFNFLNFKFIIKCYGKIINRLISGWGDFECEHVFQTLKDASQIDVHVQKILSSSLGSKQKQELLIRNFFRMICSHYSQTLENFKEKVSWLTKTLSLYSIQDIAKLFIVIFGPLVTINNSFHSLPYVAWWDLTDSNFIEKGLEDLGLTFYFLYTRSNELIWSKERVIEILECIFNTPSHWTYTNISTLLYHAGQELSMKFLDKKMKDGNVQNVALSLCHLNIITYKFTQDLSMLLNIIGYLTSENEDYGNELIEEIIQAFSNIIYDLDFNNEEVIDFLDSSEVIESQLELMKLSLLKINYFKIFNS